MPEIVFRIADHFIRANCALLVPLVLLSLQRPAISFLRLSRKARLTFLFSDRPKWISQCLVWVISGRAWAAPAMSGFGGKADVLG